MNSQHSCRYSNTCRSENMPRMWMTNRKNIVLFFRSFFTCDFEGFPSFLVIVGVHRQVTVTDEIKAERSGHDGGDKSSRYVLCACARRRLSDDGRARLFCVSPTQGAEPRHVLQPPIFFFTHRLRDWLDHLPFGMIDFVRRKSERLDCGACSVPPHTHKHDR